MNACGIITEYNPFHNGHIYHIQQARKITNCDCLIAVMSGNFVQRGEPAIIDKWERTRACLQHGVDLVLELPYPFATQSADQFAYGAIEVLSLAQVSSIVFGSESNDLTQLQALSEQVDQLEKSKTCSFVKNVATLYPSFASNDLLAISYLKALRTKPITPYTIKRTNDYRGLDASSSIASASAIRHAIAHKQDVSHSTVMADTISHPIYLRDYYPYIQTLLMTMDSKQLAAIQLMDEGLEQLLKANAQTHFTWEAFIEACTSKRYTRSRIQRTLLQVLTQTTKEEIQSLPPLSYIRVLGFTSTGRQYLSSLDKKSITIASKFKQIPEAYRKIELRSTQAYAYAFDQLKRKEEIAKEWQSLVYLK